tara:strand:- start:12328 stop:13176 length:849 start_codon:yes stop_codon:yes gene_type:complete
MHKCINNSVGNIYHLEQLVDNFFPYSQKQLGFDQKVSIIFQSDEDNASRMLGKTAYYNPDDFEIILFTDNRHPKDIVRSLSHELVHHAQNCRGEFGQGSTAGVDYAQTDPHMRRMEREAYTKGNLIFRDFEDLIKTGKINIEIDFSNSGEPKMSLKEWKNNEINSKLMKKWGLLKESQGLDEENEHPGQARDEAHPGQEHPMGESHIDLARRRGQLHKAIDSESDEDEDADDYGARLPDKMMDPDYWQDDGEEPPPKQGKISVREAKEITRRIIERIKKENN